MHRLTLVAANPAIDSPLHLDDRIRDHALFDEDVGIGDRIAAHCERRGLLVRPLGHLNVLSPPLVLDRTDIDEVLCLLRAGIEDTMDELSREGIPIG